MIITDLADNVEFNVILVNVDFDVFNDTDTYLQYVYVLIDVSDIE